MGKNHRDFSKKISKKNINDILEEILENECFEIEEIDSKTIGAKSKDPIIFSYDAVNIKGRLELVPKDDDYNMFFRLRNAILVKN